MIGEIIKFGIPTPIWPLASVAKRTQLFSIPDENSNIINGHDASQYVCLVLGMSSGGYGSRRVYVYTMTPIFVGWALWAEESDKIL